MLPHFMNETVGRRRGEGDGVEEARVHAASDTDVPSLTTALLLLPPRILAGSQRQDSHVTRERPQNPQ